MRVYEGQRLGALTVLIVSLAIYGASLIDAYRPRTELSLPWSNQRPGMITIEIIGSRGVDGIYFLPEGNAIQEILRIAGIGRIEPGGSALSDGTSIVVSEEEKILKIINMPAVRRLALGLPIDLNSSSAEDLSKIPGIGEKLAVQIVQIRQARGKFKMLSDLVTVPGIKEKKLNNIKRYLMVNSIS
jgi:competence protein ComEA